MATNAPWRARRDVRLLPQVKSPTLVLHRRQDHVGVDWSRDGLASPSRGALWCPGGDVADAVAGRHGGGGCSAIDEFLGESAEAAAERLSRRPSGLPHHPLHGHRRLHGDHPAPGRRQAREVLREHERITRECLRAHGGSEVKTMGDGFMASFGSAVKALECAVAVQKAFAAHSARRRRGDPRPHRPERGGAYRGGRPGRARRPVRHRGHQGRPHRGAGARAARSWSRTSCGELAEGKGFLFGDRGEVALRGFDDPVRLFEVRWREDA